MHTTRLHLKSEWQHFLKEELNSKNFSIIIKRIALERECYTIFPENKEIFRAFNYTNPDTLKVVILGQDPYHKIGQSDGLAFSAQKNTPLPPSLINIFKEIESDLHIKLNKKSNLDSWAKQGVLLLNSTLTVREKTPGSHQKIGWETMTDNIIKKISNRKKGVIFLLWGKYAQKKSKFIDKKKHYILTAAHPSPLSAYRGFFGCKHFSKTNEILIKNNKETIHWNL